MAVIDRVLVAVASLMLLRDPLPGQAVFLSWETASGQHKASMRLTAEGLVGRYRGGGPPVVFRQSFRVDAVLDLGPDRLDPTSWVVSAFVRERRGYLRLDGIEIDAEGRPSFRLLQELELPDRIPGAIASSSIGSQVYIHDLRRRELCVGLRAADDSLPERWSVLCGERDAAMLAREIGLEWRPEGIRLREGFPLQSSCLVRLEADRFLGVDPVEDHRVGPVARVQGLVSASGPIPIWSSRAGALVLVDQRDGRRSPLGPVVEGANSVVLSESLSLDASYRLELDEDPLPTFRPIDRLGSDMSRGLTARLHWGPVAGAFYPGSVHAGAVLSADAPIQVTRGRFVVWLWVGHGQPPTHTSRGVTLLQPQLARMVEVEADAAPLYLSARIPLREERSLGGQRAYLQAILLGDDQDRVVLTAIVGVPIDSEVPEPGARLDRRLEALVPGLRAQELARLVGEWCDATDPRWTARTEVVVPEVLALFGR